LEYAGQASQPRFIMRGLLLLAVLVIQPFAVKAADLQDATGRSIEIPDRPVRVLPAGPPAAVLLAVLAPDLMVGWPHAPSPMARQWLPDAVAALPMVPMLTGRQDVMDRAVALHPDLILDYGAVSPRYLDLMEATRTKTGIPAVLLDGALPKTPQVLRALGVALHREDRAGLLAREAEAILAAIPHARGKAPRIYYGRGSDGLVGSPGSGAGEVFALLGWEVLDPEANGTPRRTSIDAIQALDPDVLIFQDAGMRQVVATSAQWRALRAVRQHHAYVAPDVPFGWLDEPPSINRLLGLAVLSSGGRGGVPLAATFNAVVYGRAPTAQQLDTVRESLLPITP
jgi:iron complex transport system substrate-binding protein